MSEPQADMRAYCAAEILKSLISAGRTASITEADLEPADYGMYYKQGRKIERARSEMSQALHQSITVCRLITTEEQRLGRVAVTMADGLLWALESVPRPKAKG
jgi:hypothetical protein